MKIPTYTYPYILIYKNGFKYKLLKRSDAFLGYDSIMRMLWKEKKWSKGFSSFHTMLDLHTLITTGYLRYTDNPECKGEYTIGVYETIEEFVVENFMELL